MCALTITISVQLHLTTNTVPFLQLFKFQRPWMAFPHLLKCARLLPVFTFPACPLSFPIVSFHLVNSDPAFSISSP